MRGKKEGERKVRGSDPPWERREGKAEGIREWGERKMGGNNHQWGRRGEGE